MDLLTEETLDHDIDPLTTDYYEDLKPLGKSYLQQEVQTKWDVSVHGRDLYLFGTNTRSSQEIPVPDNSWGRCNNLTSNWPQQGHKVPYLVLRTTDNLSALWPDADHRTHVPGVYSVTTKLWWILHCWLTGDALWDNCRGFHSKVSEKSWILLSDMNGHISKTTPYLNQPPSDDIFNLN